MTDLTIEVGGWPRCSGSRATLYVDPEDHRVYTFGNVGSGIPMAAFHRRQMSIGDVPLDTVPESLAAWIKAHTDQIEALIAEYEGTEWDGSNHVGRWTEVARGMAESLDQEFHDDLTWNKIQTYWDATEWFDGDPGSVVDAAVQDGDIEAAVERELSDAEFNGAKLDRDDAEQALRALLQQRLDHQTADENIPKIQEMLA